jgi:hypothetical protein
VNTHAHYDDDVMGGRTHTHTSDQLLYVTKVDLCERLCVCVWRDVMVWDGYVHARAPEGNETERKR